MSIYSYLIKVGRIETYISYLENLNELLKIDLLHWWSAVL